MPHMTEEQDRKLTAVVVAARRVADKRCLLHAHETCDCSVCVLRRALGELDGRPWSPTEA